MALQKDRLLVAGTVSFYIVAALAMIMANKWVLNKTEVPIFFLFSQMVVAVILFLICHAVNVIKVPLEVPTYIVKGLAPAVGLSVVGLLFSNWTLKYVDASFYQVARGMVLPFTVCTSYLYLHSRPSSRVLAACAAVTAGFVIGVLLDGTEVSTFGVSCGVVSSAIVATHSVIIKKALEVVKGSAMNMSWYTNLLSAFALVPLIVLGGEVPAVTALFFAEPVTTEKGAMSPLATFLWGTAITGTFGFLMSIATLLSIKVTSPVTHMVSSAVRGVAASFLGVWLFDEVITSGRATSIAVILAGSIYYTWVKAQESAAPPPPGGQQPASSSSSSESGASYDRVPMEEMEKGTKPE